MFALVTISDKLHGHYESYRNDDNVIYMGFTHDYDIAEQYAKQFKIHGDKIYAAELDEEFYVQMKQNLTTGGELIEFCDEHDDSKSIIFSEEEIEMMDELASYGGLELDMQNAIENLKRYRDVPDVAKCRKMLKRIVDALTLDFNEESNKKRDIKCRDLLDEMNDSESLYERYKLISGRIGLFEEHTYNKGDGSYHRY